MTHNPVACCNVYHLFCLSLSLCSPPLEITPSIVPIALRRFCQKVAGPLNTVDIGGAYLTVCLNGILAHPFLNHATFDPEVSQIGFPKPVVNTGTQGAGGIYFIAFERIPNIGQLGE